MRVLEIDTFGENVTLEMPHTDACMIVARKRTLEVFVRQYGNVEVVKVGNCFTVPVFAESRKQFIAAKLENCSKWGCE